jgi:hypothetical protein
MAGFSASSYVCLGVDLYLNGGRIGRGEANESNTVAFQLSPLTVQWTLNLKKDDQIWMSIGYQSTGAYLYDSGAHHTHFTGFMLQEEIVSSLR